MSAPSSLTQEDVGREDYTFDRPVILHRDSDLESSQCGEGQPGDKIKILELGESPDGGRLARIVNKRNNDSGWVSSRRLTRYIGDSGTNPKPERLPMLDISHGNPFIIAAETLNASYTVYLSPDNQEAKNDYVQIWAEDPTTRASNDTGWVRNAKTMQWNIDRNDDNTYTIRCNSSQYALSLRNKDGNIEGDGRVWLLEHNDSSKSQRWHITHIPGTADNSYVISSADNPSFGLIRADRNALDCYVLVRRMWG
ncbi:MAG: RICIN domain-containing protein, partial [Pseudonocardiales bacterium]|nr:RICIN domain-containing protein [Pseudonocardiales bacterium]